MYGFLGKRLTEQSAKEVSKHFKHRREVKHRDGTREMKHAAMRKTLYSLGALAEQMKACNKRCLASISQWRDHRRERTDLRKVTRSVKDDKQRSYRGVNFFHEDDLPFMLAIAQAEGCVSGFSNRMLLPAMATA